MTVAYRSMILFTICLFAAPVAGQEASSPGPIPRKPAPDVVRDARGGVHGRIVWAESREQESQSASFLNGLPGMRPTADQRQSTPRAAVELLKNGRPVAADAAYDDGRFTLEAPSNGVFAIRVHTPDGVTVAVPCRVWGHKAAPRSAIPEIAIYMQDEIVRGQQTMRGAAVQNTALYAAAIGGAIATPIVASSVRQTRTIPTSP